MTNVDCANCAGTACTTEDIDSTPRWCPRRVTQQAIAQAEKIRSEDPEVKRCAQVAAEVERETNRIECHYGLVPGPRYSISAVLGGSSDHTGGEGPGDLPQSTGTDNQWILARRPDGIGICCGLALNPVV